MNSFLKQRIKNNISSAITINEIFLASVILLIHFLIIIFSYFSIENIGDFGNLITSSCIALIILGFPIFFSSKIIFDSSKITQNLESWFGLWGTVWLIYLIPTTFLLLFSKMSDSKVLSIYDWINLIYMGQILIRAILLFLFSHRLKIKKFGVKHIPVNKIFLILITIYSVYILFKEHHFLITSHQDVFYFQLLPASASAYITGSIILSFYYALFNGKPYIEVENTRTI